MRRRFVVLLALAGVVLSAGCSHRGCARLKGRVRGATHAASATPAASAAPAASTVVVPRTPEPIKIDGELEENAWRDVAARSGPFHDEVTGAAAIPYSDARFLRDDAALYVVLYAADEELRASVKTHDGPVWLDDAFDLRFTAPGAPEPISVIVISVAGVITDVREGPAGARDPSWESGTTVAVELDGTLNAPVGDAEEWVVEARIPLASLPGKTVDLAIRRCDTPKGAKRRCGAWRGTLALDRLVRLRRLWRPGG